MPCRHAAICLTLAPAAALGSLILASGKAAAATPPPAGAMAINSSVFRGEHIKAVTAVTEVFGRSQRTTAAIVEYGAPVRAVSADDFTVAGRTITKAYVNDRAAKAAAGRDGPFVVLELDADDDGAVIFSPDVEQAGDGGGVAGKAGDGGLRRGLRADGEADPQHAASKPDRRRLPAVPLRRCRQRADACL